MPSSTLKSHPPLHNFPLPDLKWRINHPNNHRFRRPGDSVRRSPRSNVDSDFANSGDEEAAATHPRATASSDTKPLRPSHLHLHKLASDSDSKSNIFVKLPVRNQKQCGDDQVAAADQNANGQDMESSAPKVWNLRPRRSIQKGSKASGSGAAAAAKKIAKSVPQETRSQRPELTRTRNVTEVKIGEKKREFSVSLSRDEIEEDIFAMIGSKPSRRPKKRVKSVQKYVDRVFPGLCLDSATVTADLYKVSDAPVKLL